MDNRTDIVKRLRGTTVYTGPGTFQQHAILEEAAVEIERLRDQAAVLRQELDAAHAALLSLPPGK